MRAAIFIDGGYLLKQLEDENLTPDYRRLAEYFLAPLRHQTSLDLMRCYFYYCPPWMSEKPTDAELRRMAAHERFVLEVESNGRWQMRLGKLERRREGEKEVFAQKRVDVQLSVDLVHHAAAGHIQHAVVVAGDSDFIPAIVAAKESGATLTLWCDKDKSVHRELMAKADEIHFIDWKIFPTVKASSAEEKPAPAPRAPRVAAATKAAPRAAQPRPAPEARPAPQPRQAQPRPAQPRPAQPRPAQPRRAAPVAAALAPTPPTSKEAQADDIGNRRDPVDPTAEKKPGRRRRRGGRRRSGGGGGGTPPAAN